MNKHDVMNALERCASFGDCCDDCPYRGMDCCDRHLCEDALALLQSTGDEHNVIASPTYHTAIIYTKRDNLLKWLNSRYPQFRDAQEAARIRAEYATEREIQLILLVRHEENKCICRIKCPINPLPIKGEFQCVSTSEMTRLLASMGWTYKEKVHSAMFK